jgi:hypothetical protein
MKNPVRLIKRRFPQIAGRNIYQLQRAERRLRRLANGALHADWDAFPSARAIYGQIVDKALLGNRALTQELERRRVNAPAFRSALPLKQQRLLEASMTSPA